MYRTTRFINNMHRVTNRASRVSKGYSGIHGSPFIGSSVLNGNGSASSLTTSAIELVGAGARTGGTGAGALSIGEGEDEERTKFRWGQSRSKSTIGGDEVGRKSRFSGGAGQGKKSANYGKSVNSRTPNSQPVGGTSRSGDAKHKMSVKESEGGVLDFSFVPNEKSSTTGSSLNSESGSYMNLNGSNKTLRRIGLTIPGLEPTIYRTPVDVGSPPHVEGFEGLPVVDAAVKMRTIYQVANGNGLTTLSAEAEEAVMRLSPQNSRGISPDQLGLISRASSDFYPDPVYNAVYPSDRAIDIDASRFTIHTVLPEILEKAYQIERSAAEAVFAAQETAKAGNALKLRISKMNQEERLEFVRKSRVSPRVVRVEDASELLRTRPLDFSKESKLPRSEAMKMIANRLHPDAAAQVSAIPLMDAIHTSTGKSIPLLDEDVEEVERIKELSNKLQRSGPSAEAFAESEIEKRRMIRALYNDTDRDVYVAAQKYRWGKDLINFDGLSEVSGGSMLDGSQRFLTTRRFNELREGDDPLESRNFSLGYDEKALTYRTTMNLNTLPGAGKGDKKATLIADIARLGLTKSEQQYLVAIAGEQYYYAEKHAIRISTEQYRSVGLNKRWIFERFNALVQAAKEKAASMPELALKKVPTPYQHF